MDDPPVAVDLVVIPKPTLFDATSSNLTEDFRLVVARCLSKK